MRNFRALLGACSLLALAGCHGAATIAEPLRYSDPRPDTMDADAPPTDAEHFLRAEEHEGRIWVHTASNALLSFDRSSRSVTRHLVEEKVVALERSADHLWALSIDPKTEDLRFWTHRDKMWTPGFEWMGAPAKPVALVDVDGSPVIITTAAVVRLTQDEEANWSADASELDVELDEDLARLVHTAVTSDGTVYLGARSVARESGKVYAIDPQSARVTEARSYCDLNDVISRGSDDVRCPGVTAITVDPSDDACVLVATVTSSRLKRLCPGGAEDIVTGRWQVFAFEDAPGLGSIFALPQPAEPDGLEELCAIDPDACVMRRFDSRRTPHAGRGISALAADGDALWFVLRDALVRHREGAPMFVHLLPERMHSGSSNADVEALAALTSRASLEGQSWGPKLPACFHTSDELDALCLGAGEFTFGHGKYAVHGAVVPLQDTTGAWTAELTRARGGRVRIWIDGERALVVDMTDKPAVGVALERYDAESEAALLRDLKL